MHALPPAVLIALWLNAAKVGSVTVTDATNAIETITNQIDVAGDIFSSPAQQCAWLDLVRQVAAQSVPVAVGLPVDGDPAGVPINLLSKIERSAGVVAIDRDHIIYQNLDQTWVIIPETNNVLHHDLSQSKRRLAEQISLSATQLAASELIGDETEIVVALNSFRTLHLPPHLSQRSVDALELAARIWIVARGAISNSMAIHSPSLDAKRVRVLEQLMQESRTVLQSVITA
jgi:hypothetical protein